MTYPAKHDVDALFESAVSLAADFDPHPDALRVLGKVLETGWVSPEALWRSLSHTYECPFLDVAKELLSYAGKYNVDLNAHNGHILFWAVMQDDDPAVVAQLLRAGAHVTKEAVVGAVEFKHWRVLDVLLRALPSAWPDLTAALMDMMQTKNSEDDDLVRFDDGFVFAMKKILATVAAHG